MKLSEPRRDEDATGISGTGTVAQGVIFDSGKVALTWLTEHTSTAVYDSIEDVVAIHGHGGKTRVVQVWDHDPKRWAQLVINATHDQLEGVGNDFSDGNHACVWDQRQALARLFEETEL